MHLIPPNDLIKNKCEQMVKNQDSLEMLVGSKQSLKLPIQQAKAAILYPPRGLHTIILGETGVGKSLTHFIFRVEYRPICSQHLQPRVHVVRNPLPREGRELFNWMTV